MPELYIPTSETFDYDDVILVPKKNIVKSRSEVDISVQFGPKTFANPVIPANMSTVVDENTCVWLAERNIFYVMHRFNVDAVEFTKRLQSKGLYSSISLGIKQVDYDTIDRFVAEGVTPEYVTVDVAHGDSEEVFKIVRVLKDKLPAAFVMAGNLATPEGALRLVEAGADAVKIGIGPGCFAAGTKVLMANGTYKNIESIKIGDRVINKDGKPVNVIGTRNSGLRLVQKYKHANWYTHSYATADHKHFGIDMEGLRSTAVTDEGYAKIADKTKKTKGSPDRKQWLELSDENLGALLFPRNVTFEMPTTFNISLKPLARNALSLKAVNTEITPTYELGYIFGTFLGDGSARIPTKKKESGKVSWTFGLEERTIAEKLAAAIRTTVNVPIKIVTKDNVLLLELNSTVWARFLYSFGKKVNKHLPTELFVSEKEYLKGLYDGLMDSDGHVEDGGREAFTNTSTKLIELFSTLTLILKGFIPNQASHNDGNLIGGLAKIGNVNENNFNPAYRTRLNVSADKRFTKDYYCVKFTEKPKTHAMVETYDIEVDCPTHSFIANNVIVHNSACLTAPNTGFGTQGWQLSAVANVAKALAGKNVKIIADGGIRKYGDFAKSIAFGADMIMVGGMLSAHLESPGEIIDIDGNPHKAFFGSASEHQKGEKKHVEGKKMFLPYKGSLEDTFQIIKENLQSSVSYAGGRDLLALRDVSYARVR